MKCETDVNEPNSHTDCHIPNPQATLAKQLTENKLEDRRTEEAWNQTILTNMTRMHFDEAYRLEIAKNLS